MAGRERPSKGALCLHLYSFSRNLMAAGNGEELLRYAAREIAEAFECEVMILLPDETGRLKERAKMGEHLIFDERKLGVATWVFRHGQEAGHGTETFPQQRFSTCLCMRKRSPLECWVWDWERKNSSCLRNRTGCWSPLPASLL